MVNRTTHPAMSEPRILGSSKSYTLWTRTGALLLNRANTPNGDAR